MLKAVYGSRDTIFLVFAHKRVHVMGKLEQFFLFKSNSNSDFPPFSRRGRAVRTRPCGGRILCKSRDGTVSFS